MNPETSKSLAYEIDGTLENGTPVKAVLFFQDPPTLELLREIGFRDVCPRISVVSCEAPPKSAAVYFYPSSIPAGASSVSCEITKVTLNPNGSPVSTVKKTGDPSVVIPARSIDSNPILDLPNKAWLICGQMMIGVPDSEDNSHEHRILASMVYLVFGPTQPNTDFLEALGFERRNLRYVTTEQVTCDSVPTSAPSLLYFQQKNPNSPVSQLLIDSTGHRFEDSLREMKLLSLHDFARWFNSATVVKRLFPSFVDVQEEKNLASGRNSLIPDERPSRPGKERRSLPPQQPSARSTAAMPVRPSLPPNLTGK